MTKANNNKIARRETYMPASVRLREAEDGIESRIVEGYALKFGVRSRLLLDWWRTYYEVLEPGCLTRETLDASDIKLTLFHDRQLILARSKNGVGTLHYEVNDIGVFFWAELPHTADGDKARELVKRGDIDGCSFMYVTDEEDSENCVSYETIEEDGEEILLRHVKKILRVFDYTLTPDPAYIDTEVACRDMEHAGLPAEKPAEQKHEPVEVVEREEVNAPDEAVRRENIAKIRMRIKNRRLV